MPHVWEPLILFHSIRLKRLNEKDTFRYMQKSSWDLEINWYGHSCLKPNVCLSCLLWVLSETSQCSLLFPLDLKSLIAMVASWLQCPSEGTITTLPLLDNLTVIALLFTKWETEIHRVGGKRSVKVYRSYFYPWLYLTEEMVELMFRNLLLDLKSCSCIRLANKQSRR